MCSLSNSMIITITRIESTCFNRRAHTVRVVHNTRNRLSVPESQSNNLALVHETQRSTPPFSQELLTTSKGIVFLPFRWPNHAVTSGCDDLCNIICRLHTAAGVRSLIVDWNGLHLIQRIIRIDRLIYVVIHHCVLC